MNYEELFETLSSTEKSLKDTVNSAVRYQKAAVKNTEAGNLADLEKTLSLLEAAASAMTSQVESLKEQLSSFDTRAYFVNGDFTRQLLEECAALEINVKGDHGTYEMFPYKVRIYGDAEHTEEIWINRKKQASFRPKAIASAIKAGQTKLYKANFNETSFMNELAEAYDTTCLKNGLRNGSTLSMTKIYKALTPMARARKEYDMQAFAFDLARIYEKGEEHWVTKTGRMFTFGTSRDGKTGIRVLSSTGTETYIITLRPLNSGQEE